MSHMFYKLSTFHKTGIVEVNEESILSLLDQIGFGGGGALSSL